MRQIRWTGRYQVRMECDSAGRFRLASGPTMEYEYDHDGD